MFIIKYKSSKSVDDNMNLNIMMLLQVPFTEWNANRSRGFISFGISCGSAFEQKL